MSYIELITKYVKENVMVEVNDSGAIVRVAGFDSELEMPSEDIHKALTQVNE